MNDLVLKSQVVHPQVDGQQDSRPIDTSINIYIMEQEQIGAVQGTKSRAHQRGSSSPDGCSIHTRFHRTRGADGVHEIPNFLDVDEDLLNGGVGGGGWGRAPAGRGCARPGLSCRSERCCTHGLATLMKTPSKEHTAGCR